MKKENEIIYVSAHPDLKAELTPFGAGLKQLYFKGRELLCSGTEEEYFRKNASFYGQTVAPFAGRILHGEMGRFHFPTNEGPNCLHSGDFTTAFQPFEYGILEREDDIVATFAREQTVEGVRIVTTTTYTFLRKAPKFSIRIDVSSSEPFPHNQTHHAYWNLGAKNLCDIDIRFASRERVNYDANKHPVGYVDCRGEFDGDKLKLDDSLDYGYLLEKPLLEARCGNVLLKANSKAKAVLIFTGHPGTKPCFTLEFVNAPLNDESMLHEGLTSVLAEYELEEI